RHGQDTVEDFIDTCLSLENRIEPMSPYIVRSRETKPDDEDDPPDKVGRLRAKGYMESFINPPEYLAKQRKKRDEEEKKQKRRFPERPQRDVLAFLIEHAPLDHWQTDVLEIVRDEAYYFAPQAMTKILNEGWACVVGKTNIFTDLGMIPMDELVRDECGNTVFDGSSRQRVYDRNIIYDHPTVRVRTRRGLELEGSNNHRVLLADGQTWKRLDELSIGDRIAVAGGGNMWPEQETAVPWQPATRVGLEDVAAAANVSVWTVLRHRAGRATRSSNAIAAALESYETEVNQALSPSLAKRAVVRIPEKVDVDFGAFLGYLVGDGHISRVKRHFGLTTGDEPQADRFLMLGRSLFDVLGTIRMDE